jgi:hypothetical protein
MPAVVGSMVERQMAVASHQRSVLPASSDLTLIGFHRIGLNINSDDHGSPSLFQRRFVDLQ